MRIAQNSARFPDKFVFTVVNNPEFNACARMGGFIYVHTGALLWMNDEAELAALIGHEVGHAIKRHPAHSANRSSASTSLLRMLSMRRRSPEQFQQMQVNASLALLAYDRNEETQADDLGLQINTKIGLDPRGAARMLYQLELSDRFLRRFYGTAYVDKPVYLSKHPLSTDRVRRSAAMAQEAAQDLPHNRDRFLSMINGMRVGPSPLYGNRVSRVRIVTVGAGDTAQRLSAQMAAPRLKLELFLAMNGYSDAADVRPGMKVKILV
jgi:predicted Zn-dependent protease